MLRRDMTMTVPHDKNVARVVGVHDPNQQQRAPTPSGRILLKPDTADIVRHVAKHLNITLDELIQRMLLDWIPDNTDLSIETDEGNLDK